MFCFIYLLIYFFYPYCNVLYYEYLIYILYILIFVYIHIIIYLLSFFLLFTHSYSVLNDATNSLPNRFARSAEVRDRDAVLLAVARRLQVEVQPRQDDARAVGRPDVQRAVLVVPVVQRVWWRHHEPVHPRDIGGSRARHWRSREKWVRGRGKEKEDFFFFNFSFCLCKESHTFYADGPRHGAGGRRDRKERKKTIFYFYFFLLYRHTFLG